MFTFVVPVVTLELFFLPYLKAISNVNQTTETKTENADLNSIPSSL